MDYTYIPKRAFFEPQALEYPLGQKIMDALQKRKIEIKMTGSHNRVTGIPGKTPQEAFFEGKRTLVVGVRKGLNFQTCKPSAHYQLPLVTSCPGQCEYCYLNTTLGKKPYIRIYVNIDEILQEADQYIKRNAPNITKFEGAATSDPLPVEPYTQALAKTIEFFGKQEYGRFRFVTKFTNVDSLLHLDHQGHTRIRFTFNADYVIKNYERATPRLEHRMEAALKVALAGYPLGFIIGPILRYDQWEEGYEELFYKMGQKFSQFDDLKLELITHRFTKNAKANIQAVFPETTLPMDEEMRVFKFGQFGYGKYVYPKAEMEEMKAFFQAKRAQYLPLSKISYFV